MNHFQYNGSNYNPTIKPYPIHNAKPEKNNATTFSIRSKKKESVLLQVVRQNTHHIKISKFVVSTPAQKKRRRIRQQYGRQGQVYDIKPTKQTNPVLNKHEKQQR
jgi:hypothetical protein